MSRDQEISIWRLRVKMGKNIEYQKKNKQVNKKEQLGSIKYIFYLVMMYKYITIYTHIEKHTY